MRQRILSAVLAVWGLAAGAQDFDGRARVEATQGDLTAGLSLDLRLSQPVPYRVALWDGPPRLVLDFRQVALDQLSQDLFVPALGAVRWGRAVDGWSRLVFDLPGPVRLDAAGMSVDPETSRARLNLALSPLNGDAAAGWAKAEGAEPAQIPTSPDTGPVIVIDPGHGGSDPGRTWAATTEAEAMLGLARLLREALRRDGIGQVHLTRETDGHVGLDTRLRRARETGADIFLSLHGDPAAAPGAIAAVQTLADAAAPRATALLAERGDRATMLGPEGVPAQGDRTARVLLSLARQETAPESRALARALALGLDGAGAARATTSQAAILKGAQTASVMVALGDMPAAPDWDTRRQQVAADLSRALRDWWAERAARR